MAELRITHTPESGTLVTGTAHDDGTNTILKPCGFRWSRTIACWYVPRSRDRITPDRARIDEARRALEAAGHTVHVDVGYDDRRSVAERETDRDARAADRAAYHDQAADRAASHADQRFTTAERMQAAIPFGQPILADHHSHTRDRNYRARISRHIDRGVGEAAKAEYHARRARAAETEQRLRHNPRVIMRRLDAMLADRRKLQRTLDGRPGFRRDDRGEWRPYLARPEGEDQRRLEAEAADLDDRIRYWREQLDEAKRQGFHEYGPTDVAKGDEVRSAHGWHRVLRVNKKTVTVPAVIDRLAAAGYTDTLPWDKVLEVRRPGPETR